MHGRAAGARRVGVGWVQCLEGDEIWRAAEAGRWNAGLVDLALASMTEESRAIVVARAHAPALFLLEYLDGVKGEVLMLDRAIDGFAFAGGPAESPEGVNFGLPDDRPFEHFTYQVRQIENLVLTGRPPNPVERTLLTTGILDAAMRSRHQGHARIETLELAIAYQAPSLVADAAIAAPLPRVSNTPPGLEGRG